MHSPPNRTVWVRALVGDFALCSWGRHLTLTVPLSTQVYKRVPENSVFGVALRWTCSHPGGSRNTPSLFMLLTLPDEPLGSHADFILPSFSKNVRFQNYFRTHESKFRLAFSNCAECFEVRFRKASFSWRFSVDGRPNRRNKAAFQTSPGEWGRGLSFLVGVDHRCGKLACVPTTLGRISLMRYLFSQGRIQLCSRQHLLRSCSRCGKSI